MTIEVVDLAELAKRPPHTPQEIGELVKGVVAVIDWIRAKPERTAAALAVAALIGVSLTAGRSGPKTTQ